MPETFSTILDALADEGRSRMRPFPATSIHALGRARQRRRQRLVVATSGVVACAVAAGIALGSGGSHSTAPVAPGPTTSPGWTPPAQAPVDLTRFLRDSELPNAGVLQWKHDVAINQISMDLYFDICGSSGQGGQRRTVHAQSAQLVQYRSPIAAEGTFETVYHFASEAAAHQEYSQLVPDTAQCASHPLYGYLSEEGKKTGDIGNGFAWSQTGKSADANPNATMTLTEHAIVVQSGSDLALLALQEYGSPAYDTSGDQAVLQRMADRLAGKPVTPITPTTPPGTLTDSAWLTPTEIPFAKADTSTGWYYMGSSSPQGPGADPASDVCAMADSGVVDGKDSTAAGHMLHGSPATVPVDPASNYLYSSANETIHAFPSASAAAASFEHAKQLTTVHSCTFKDDKKATVGRTVKNGPVTSTAFSVAIDDASGMATHNHLYVVIKGTHVAELSIHFQTGANAEFGGDAAVLDLMANHLP